MVLCDAGRRSEFMSLMPSIDPEEAVTIIKSFVKTYIEGANIDSVVLGLSGGIDSAVMAVICNEVLGAENTHCLFLPDNVTPKKDADDVKKLVDAFGLSCDTVDITEMVDLIKKSSAVTPDKMTEANIKARLRMVLLYAYANKTNSLVCGTSNKSELLIGYFTKYGDGGVDFMPLGDVYKTHVLDIARHLNIPVDMIEKPPTAGLWKGQTDEQELKLKYAQLDQILVGLEKKMDHDTIAEKIGISVDDVKRIQKLRKVSQHKRRLALILKMGLRTPGLDWRSPVMEG